MADNYSVDSEHACDIADAHLHMLDAKYTADVSAVQTMTTVTPCMMITMTQLALFSYASCDTVDQDDKSKHNANDEHNCTDDWKYDWDAGQYIYIYIYCMLATQ
jgi:hypothetical protein